MSKLPDGNAKKWDEEPMYERANLCIAFLYTYGLITKTEKDKAIRRLWRTK